MRGRRRTKKFRSPAKRQVAGYKERLPGGTGFISLTGTGVYNQALQQLRIQVTGRRRPDNLGPGVFIQETVEWDRGRAPDAARRLVTSAVERVAALIKGKQHPEVGMFLEECSPGPDHGVFMETTCPTCRCWYCELSDV
jgi:hypothetical protein